MKLSDLLSSISLSVQQAQQTIDKDAADTFMMLTESIVEAGVTNNSGVKIPMAALMHHRPLLLDEVKVRMNAYFKMEKDGIFVETTALKASAEDMHTEKTEGPAELCLTYKGSDPSEGIARMTNKMNCNL